MKRVKWFVVGAGLMFVQACVAPTWYACRQIAKDSTKEYKYTDKQAAIGCERAVLKKVANYNEKIGKWELNRKVISVSDQMAVLKDRADALNKFLSYDDPELARFIDWFPGLRKGITKEEKITLWLINRMLYMDSYNKFTDLVGELPKEILGKEAEYFFEYGRQAYSMRMLYPLRDVFKIPFSASYLEAAKEREILVLVDTFTVFDKQSYGKKITDLRDPNEFSWEQIQRGWRIDSYKITPDLDKPADNIAQYIEVYRIDGNARKESKPAIRGFVATGGNSVSVLVMDYDKEGESGFGSPDTVERIFLPLVTGRELYADESYRRRVLDPLYEKPQNNEQNPKRHRPLDVPVYIAIAPMGKKIDVEIWERGDWKLPFGYSYRTLAQNLKIVYDKPKTPQDQELENKEKLKKLLVLIREFKENNQTAVIEYWVPKAEYMNRDIVDSFALSNTLRIRRRGLVAEEADVMRFGRYIKNIDYRYGGKWFRLEDEDGDGVFEKRRMIADPTSGESSVNWGNYALGE